MLKIAGIWGSVAGVLYIILTWLSLAMRQELNQVRGWPAMNTALYILILGVFIFIAMRQARRSLYNQLGINYAQTLYVGVCTAVVTGFLTGIFAFCYIQYVEPNLGDLMVVEATEGMMKQKIPAKDIQEMTVKFKNSYTPGNQLMTMLIFTTVLGIISSALLAIFVRNRDTFSSN
jgi:Protein of unknown function (DUF4199)